MATIVKKDVAITPVSVVATRKVMTGFSFDPTISAIILCWNQYALDLQGNQLSLLTSGQETITSTRFTEPLIAAWLTASNNLILNEF